MAIPQLAPVRRGVGVIRVSKVGRRQRTPERFLSPTEQRHRIEAICELHSIALEQIFEEVDVSGGRSLERRHGLRQAIEWVERGDGEVIVVAYFDRLVRNLEVQAQVLRRVENARGLVLAVDVGEVRTDTAAHWLNATMHGMMAEYYRRTTSERTTLAKRGAVERGVPPFPNIIAGYRRGADGRLEIMPAEAEAVAGAFAVRAEGGSVAEVRRFLQAQGVEMSYRRAQVLLGSRLVLGELRYGDAVNATAHPAIVDRVLWHRAQRTADAAPNVHRGRRSQSERLLARLEVLRCGSCNSRLTVAHIKNRYGTRYAIYRCGMPMDCPAAVTIAATVAEEAVSTHVCELLADMRGVASSATGLADAEAHLDEAQRTLVAAIEAFTAVDPAYTRPRLAELQADVDRASERVARLRASAPIGRSLDPTADWERMSIDGRRGLIRAVLSRALVMPGRGRERVVFEGK